VVATNNPCPVVQAYFFEKIDVPYRDHSEVCPRLVSSQEIQGNSTRGHTLSSGVVICDIVEIVEIVEVVEIVEIVEIVGIVESTAGHGEVVRLREDGAAIP
jgi:hypothetical protein